MPYEETFTLSNRDPNRDGVSRLLPTNRNNWHNHNDRYYRNGQQDATQKRNEDARLCERNALAYSRWIYCSRARALIPKTAWIDCSDSCRTPSLIKSAQTCGIV